MSDHDFVERLRIRWEAMGDMANSERAAAADEIEFLRRSQRELMGQVATLREERDEQDEHNARMDHILTRTANALHGGYAPPDCLHSWHDLPELVEKLRKERDEARRLLKAVVDMMRDNMAHDATHPHHLCDFIHRPDIGMCKVCEDWTDAMVMCYPDDFQDEEDGK